MKSKFLAFYDDAERLSVKEGKTQKEISRLLGVSEKTLSQWSVKGEWQRQRKEYLVSSRTGPVDKLKERFYRLLESEDELDAKKTDEMYKIQLLIDRMEGYDIKGATIEVMDRFATFIRQRETDTAFIQCLMDHTHAFFEEVKKG
ncbi:hypothetical protein KsCSTR_18510 [Candidatus Kuenenia stuttgartiensis]|uniref:Uncharacterized protein n=1 Tax=Kuenenia stuttgartiensis TaxID=174633 RepID=A0A6G7GNP7_KUEST|nr:helix-turn-helix domain-containing protein [Candidatus Kuenenia stuttgartiensis]QII11230.1 hypothetical protein KsCSTR_18510 [Candidatus Kuenenia stuttgartiensis]